MKKILTIFAAAAMFLGLASCSGDMHNDWEPSKIAILQGTKNTILDVAGIIGTINDWKDTNGVENQGDALTKVDDTTYTYKFTATAETAQFCLQEERAAKWTKPRYCGYATKDDAKALAIKPGDSDKDLVYTTDPDPSHVQVSGLKKGIGYIVTVKIKDAEKHQLTISLAKDADAEVVIPPTPFYLAGYFLRGDFNGWNAELGSALWQPTLDDAKGILTYKYDFVPTATEINFKIATSDWSSEYKGATIAAGGDAVEVTTTGDGNNKITGLTSGSNYRLEVITTPEKKVSCKVYEIASYTIKFKITNLEGSVDKVWMNGSFWGGWDTKWPILSWNNNEAIASDAKYPLSAQGIVTDGSATMGDEFNVTGVASIGEKLSKEVKFIATNDNWTSTKYDNGNIAVEVTISASGTYWVTINAEANTATVTKE